MIEVFETNSPEETDALGRKLGESATPGQVFTLIGDLGVGKLTGKTTYVLTLTKKELEVKTSYDGYNNDLSKRKLTYEDVAGKSKRELEIMRNMIFARYGYRFKRDELANFFLKYSWYKPTTSDGAIVYDKMTAIEQYNIEFIKKHEK